MTDSQILSVFPDSAPAAKPSGAGQAFVFDACHVGVVLRAVLFVQLVMAIGAMFGSPTAGDWVAQLALFAGGALPATLVWLVAACCLKRLLARVPVAVQYTAGVGLGALSGLYGCGMLVLVGLLTPAPWVACAFTGAALAAALVWALILRAKSRAPAATTARLAELQSRIRPHFLFNTLNSAIALVRAEPAKAEALLEDLSDLFRHALMEQGESVSLADELMLAERYLAIEQVRFGDRLQLVWDLDPAASNALLPPLLLQPLVENAIRHGVEPSASGAKLSIATERRGARVVIKIQNTVPAGPGEPGHGLALANVRDRLNLLHDLQGQFQSRLKDGVFRVRIEVPV
jgi:two-component system sensor histidine kinase AlgZ